jgi:O-antigen/teichoic acid export membrane protein
MIRRSLLFSFVDKYANVALSLTTMAIVARILTPAEVGLFMVASAAVILVETFRDFGVGACIVQERDMTPELVRTAFTIMALLSALLASVLLVSAGPMAAFYGEPELKNMLQIATLGFFMAPFSSPLLALMRRDMAFDRIARINIAAAVINSAATVTFALLGFGSLSFVWASVIAATTTTLLAIQSRPEFWVFRPTLTEWCKVIPFGTWSSIVTLLSMLFDFMPRLILGRTLTFDAVGLYARAVALCQLPERAVLSALQPVILPVLAARVRDGGNLKEPYLLGLAYVSVVQWPALVCLALLADPIIRLLLGSQWLEIVPLVRIVALASLSLFPMYLTYPVLVSVGRVRDMVTASLISLPPSLLIVFGASWLGLDAVALSLFLTGPFQVYVALWFIRQHVPFTWGELARAVYRSALVTLYAAAVPASVIAWSGSKFNLTLPQAAFAGAGALLGWLVGLRLSGHPLDPEIRYAGLALRRAILRPLWRLP